MTYASRRPPRTTAIQRVALRRTRYLTGRIGTGLKEVRLSLGLLQREAADRAGIAQPYWSRVERGLEPGVALDTLACCAAAVDTQLASFIEAMPGADLPRDIEHLRRQALIVELARPGGWTAEPESMVVGDGRNPRSIDVLLLRDARREAAVVEIWDLILDGGAAMRGLAAKVAATQARLGPEHRVAGLFVARGTHRNRALIRELSGLFAARFPASSNAWIAALTSVGTPMPDGSGFAWTTVRGDRLMVARHSRQPRHQRSG